MSARSRLVERSTRQGRERSRLSQKALRSLESALFAALKRVVRLRAAASRESRVWRVEGTGDGGSCFVEETGAVRVLYRVDLERGEADDKTR